MLKNILRIVTLLPELSRLYHRTGGACYRRRQLHPPYPLVINGEKCGIFSDDSEASRACYCEVVVNDSYGIYQWQPQVTNPLIVDIGSNIGTFSVLAKRMFPQSEVHAYEPHPIVLEWTRKNAAAHGFHLHEVAVSNRNYKTKLNSDLVPTCAMINATDGFDVDAIAANEVCEGREIDFLKVDCEGAEHSIFESGELLSRTKSVRLEYHGDDLDQVEQLRQRITTSGLTITYDLPFPIAGGLLGILHASR